MSVFVILAIDRGSMTAAKADDIVNLAIENKSRGVVGVDICGNPTKGDVSIYKEPFAKAKANVLGITFHFAVTTQASYRPFFLSSLTDWAMLSMCPMRSRRRLRGASSAWSCAFLATSMRR